MRQPLPIDSVTPAVVSQLRQSPCLVLEAPPGAGKTTRIPPALLDLNLGQVLVLEPRRLAARMAAARVANEMGERVGGTVGYQVRFEDVSGPSTRLRFLTEGVLTRRLLSDPQLRGAGTVVLDEFHERHLDGDLALALLRRLQLTTRPELRIVVMSATLDTGPISRYLGDAPCLKSEGRQFEVAEEFAGYSAAPLEQQVAAAADRLLTDGLDGDVLVFLPGAAEIHRAQRACQSLADRAGLLLLPLHGDLSPEDQDRAVQPAPRRKIILSTNVAESSITIDGVTAVIDSGLARIAGDSPWTGLPTLEVKRISKASARQRAGRAGRTQPGRVVRLYSPEDFARRPDYDTPEIGRRELSQVLLELRMLGAEDLEWFEAPPASAWQQARELLDRLGAARHARAMSHLPLHPRLARVVVEAEQRFVTGDATAVAALLSSGARSTTGDLLHLLDSDLPPRAKQVKRQLDRRLKSTRGRPSPDALAISVLTGFPDRAGRRRGETQVQLASGGFAALSAPWSSEFLVVVDVEDRRDNRLPLVRLAIPIEPDWLLDLFPERIRERNEVSWNRTAERVEASSALLYDDLVIQESRHGAPDPESASRLLAAQALEAGIEKFVDGSALEALRARVAFAAAHSAIQEIDADQIRSTLESLCTGLKSFAELRNADILGALRPHGRLLDEIAPEYLPIQGRRVKVNYVRNQPPWLESRLQDFFGMTKTPTVAGGKVPVLLHLLAPNRRPVQMTTDLAGFWVRLYPQLRKELSRRYPKHAWPENP